jgi:hypothetical protein
MCVLIRLYLIANECLETFKRIPARYSNGFESTTGVKAKCGSVSEDLNHNFIFRKFSKIWKIYNKN